MTAHDIATAALLLTGAAFCLLSAIGLLRFPDTAARLHAAAKAQSLGLLLIWLGAATRLAVADTLVLVLVAVFQLVTVPVTAQVVGRTTYRSHALDARGVVLDELGERLATTSPQAPRDNTTSQSPPGAREPRPPGPEPQEPGSDAEQ